MPQASAAVRPARPATASLSSVGPRMAGPTAEDSWTLNPSAAGASGSAAPRPAAGAYASPSKATQERHNLAPDPLYEQDPWMSNNKPFPAMPAARPAARAADANPANPAAVGLPASMAGRMPPGPPSVDSFSNQ